MTTQHIALTPRERKLPKLFQKFCPLGVVVRFRAVFTENISLRPYGQQLLKLFCSWDRKKLGTHVIAICWVVINKTDSMQKRPYRHHVNTRPECSACIRAVSSSTHDSEIHDDSEGQSSPGGRPGYFSWEHVLLYVAALLFYLCACLLTSHVLLLLWFLCVWPICGVFLAPTLITITMITSIILLP